MKHTRSYNILALLLIFTINVSFGQLKGLKKGLKKQIVKTVKQNVKPLELEFHVTRVEYKALKSPNKILVHLDFEGHNPNAVGVNLSRIEFDIYVDGKFAAKVYNDKKIKIPKEGDFRFKEKASVKLSTAGKALFNAIRKKKAVYKVDGTYFVFTKIGEFKFKATLMEKKK